jgi:hypothetical protein
MAHAIRGLAAVALLPLLPAIASACAVCDSELGRQVRAGVFNSDFVPRVLAVLAPFPLFLVAIGLVRFALPILMAPPARQSGAKGKYD